MTEPTDLTPVPDDAPDEQPAPRKRGSLASMRVADLKELAGALGVAGADGMRKPQLLTAIKEVQSGAGRPAEPTGTPGSGDAPEPAGDAGSARPRVTTRERSARRERASQPEASSAEAPQDRQPAREQTPHVPEADARVQQDRGQGTQDEAQGGKQQRQARQEKGQKQGRSQQQAQQQAQQKQEKGQQGQKQDAQQGQKQDAQQGQKQDAQQGQKQDAQDAQGADDGEEGGSRRNRRRRGRENRDGNQRQQRRGEPDTQVLEDDVLVPAAGILDVLENYAFVRTSGYLPGPDDVYLSLSLVRKFGLRRGDAVKGQVRQPREGERREKFNPMVRIDSVNGADPDAARERPEFDALTPVHPTERIRLETGPDDLTGRAMDLLVPLGKGQRCLVRAEPRSGRGALLRSIAASVLRNAPEAHLMVVLLHERPEEITDVRRSVAGEVIASGFDRQPADHVGVAELAVERAKRLVELGHDVVVLLDSLTRLARAHHHAAGSGGGRTSGLDITALQPPKQVFGAGRALEEGGSLTMVATVPVGTGSATDELVVEELEDTSTAEIRLSGAVAAAGVTPAIDPFASGTRHEEQLLGAEELGAVSGVRAGLLRGADATSAMTAVTERLAASRTNIELLTRVTKNGR